MSFNFRTLFVGLRKLSSEIQYLYFAIKAKIEGTVIVTFIVKEFGDIENPQICRCMSGDCDENKISTR